MVLAQIMCIIAGLVLTASILGALPAIGTHLETLAKWLGKGQTVIGVLAIIIGIFTILSIQGIMLIIAGLVLAIGILPSIPALGEHLEKLAKILAGVQVPIGVLAIIIGIIGLL